MVRPVEVARMVLLGEAGGSRLNDCFKTRIGMPTFFVRTMRPNERRVAGEWQEIQAETASAAGEQVCGFPVVEGGKLANVCAEARAGSKAGMGRMYRRA